VTTFDHQARRQSATAPMLVALVLSLLGFALTLVALYPGYFTNDATFVYGYIKDWHLGDWQSPLMTMLWWLVDPISPGSGSMFLLIVALYWLGFGIVALAVARRAGLAAIAVPLLALAPPALILLSMIWRDILLSSSWLVAAALLYAVAERGGPLRWTAQVVALLLIGFGILLRPNAIVAAPLLITYALWPARIEWKRTALAFIPLIAAGYGLIHLVYYDTLHVKRENPLHSLLVFDLGGISYFAHENAFPVTWSAEQNALVLGQCYNPHYWDSYWTLAPCNFVMARLEHQGEPIFGTPRLVEAWEHAVAAHPLSYVEHRLTVLWTFLGRENMILELYKLAPPDPLPLAHNSYFLALLWVEDAIKSSALFRPGYWLLLSVAIAAWAWHARSTASGAFAVSVTASGVVYLLSFGVLGVATDFRYAHWGVVAALAALVPALIARREERFRKLQQQFAEGVKQASIQSA
jgi:hypothetical protein